tara:strand:+ start:2976 stop:3407 length:432 start_codon:yes stop_codon:yes gene_type:complete
MSKLWDDLKENMKDWSSSAVEKAEEMSKIAMAKTEEMTRISKLKFEIHQSYRTISKENEKLGKLVYEHTKNDHMATFSGNSDFFDMISNIDEIKKNIKLKKNEIENIKIEHDIDEDEISEMGAKEVDEFKTSDFDAFDKKESI